MQLTLAEFIDKIYNDCNNNKNLKDFNCECLKNKIYNLVYDKKFEEFIVKNADKNNSIDESVFFRYIGDNKSYFKSCQDKSFNYNYSQILAIIFCVVFAIVAIYFFIKFLIYFIKNPGILVKYFKDSKIYLNRKIHSCLIILKSRSTTNYLLNNIWRLSAEEISIKLKDNPNLYKANIEGLTIPDLILSREDLVGTECFFDVESEIYPQITDKIKQNYDILLLKATQKLYYDDYNVFVVDDFEREFSYFVKRVLSPETEEFHLMYLLAKGLFRCILKQNGINSLEEIKTKEISDKLNICSGVDYENYIENILLGKGFKVHRTPITGDQGVDLIAVKDNIKYAIQCKYYSKPVGNKAVQEIIAGKDFYKCDIGIVVSNNSFTKSAVVLAQNSHILLSNENSIICDIEKNEVW